MKSLFAILALTGVLGVGYWKMENPEAGLEDAKAQANGLRGRLVAGFNAVKSGGSQNVAEQKAATLALTEKIDSQSLATTNRLTLLETQLEDKLQASDSRIDESNARLESIEQSMAATRAGDETSLAVLDQSLKDLSSATTEQFAVLENSVNEKLAAAADSSAAQNESALSRESLLKESALSRDNLRKVEQEIEAKLNGFSTRLDTLASTKSVNADGASLEALALRLDKRMADIEQGLATVSRNDGNGAELKALQENLKVTDSEIYLATSKIAELENRINSAATPTPTTDVDNIEKSVSSLKIELTALQKDIQGIQEKLAQPVTATTQAAPVDLSPLVSDIDSLQKDVQEIRADFNTAKSSIESSSIESSQTQLQQQLIALESDVRNAAPATDVSSLNAALDQSRQRIVTLEQRVTELPAAEAASAKQVQIALEKQIVALEKRLSENANKPDEKLVSSLTAVEKKVTDLENRNYVTPEQLEQLSKTKSIQYKIYFDVDSVAITENASKVLDSVIAQESNRATGLSIFGTTDRTGPSDYNQVLAVRRANRARSYLIQRGFEFSKINDVDGIGEDLAAAKLPDGSDDQNQRSVIIYAFQP